MNEEEIKLIREYVHIEYLIKAAAKELEYLKVSRYSLISLLQRCVAGIGINLKSRKREVKRELATLKIHVWIEDDGGEIIFICTSKNMVKGRHGMKRSVLYEDMEHTLNRLSPEFFHEAPKPNKPVLNNISDPYEK